MVFEYVKRDGTVKAQIFGNNITNNGNAAFILDEENRIIAKFILDRGEKVALAAGREA